MKLRFVTITALIALACGAVMGPALAQDGGNPVAQSPATGEFAESENGCPAFEVDYDVTVVDHGDGTYEMVMKQQGTSDQPSGVVGPEGFPPTLEHPGVERFTNGRKLDARRLAYGYEWIEDPSCGVRRVVIVMEDGTVILTRSTAPARPADAKAPAASGSDSAPASDGDGGGLGLALKVLLGLLVLLAILAVAWFLVPRAASDDDNWFWKLVKGLLRIRGRKGRLGSSVDMKTVEEAVETVEEVAPDIGEKQEMAEQKQAQDEALGEDPPPDSHDTGIPFMNWVAGLLFDRRYSSEERERRDQERKEKARRKKYEEWQKRPESHSQYCGFHQPGVCHGECPPANYDDATPEQLAQFDEWLGGEAAPAQ